jgi:endonuclease I
MFEEWHAVDPADAFEFLRDQRIEAIQGNKNTMVRP